MDLNLGLAHTREFVVSTNNPIQIQYLRNLSCTTIMRMFLFRVDNIVLTTLYNRHICCCAPEIYLRRTY